MILKYLSVLFYYIFPNYSKVRNIYYDEVRHIVKYLQNINIGEKLKLNELYSEVCNLVTITRFGRYYAYKIAIYKAWDLKKEFLPTDTAWILIDGNNTLIAISFDKELFYSILLKKVF